jgi:HlyD family secretion protein
MTAGSRLPVSRRADPRAGSQYRLTLLAVALAIGVTVTGCSERPRTVSGMVRVRDFALGSRVGGKILSIEKQEGEQVRKGETLVRIDPSRLLAERAVLEATLAEAEAKYRELKAGATKEEIERARADLAGAEAQYRQALSGFRDEDIRAAQREVAGLESQYEEARMRAERVIALHEKGFASTNERDAAEAARDALKARLEVARENLAKLTRGLRPEEIEAAEAAVEARKAVLARLMAGATRDALAAAKARVHQVRAQRARLELDLADTLIVAPQDGFVETLLLETGEIASPGQPVVILVAPADLWIEFFAPASALDRLAPGHRLKAVADTAPGKPFEIEIFFMSREAEFTPRNVFTPEERLNQVYRVKARPAGTSLGLRAGMNVTIFLPGK